MAVNAALVRELAELLDSNRLSEIEVTDGDRSIRVARTMSAAPVAAVAPVQSPAAPAAAAPAGGDSWAAHPGVVKSPIVGTAYLTPEPGAAPFVGVGDTVSAGQTLLIVEAMKVMNPITAPKAGTVSAVLVQSEQPVEYDQPLVVIG
jgi:acetyl-CoA carboxylase biotin carboxyl carrier protein